MDERERVCQRKRERERNAHLHVQLVKKQIAYCIKYSKTVKYSNAVHTVYSTYSKYSKNAI